MLEEANGVFCPLGYRECGYGILGEVNDAVIAVDNERKITYINAACERMYMVEAESCIGQQIGYIYQSRWQNEEERAIAEECLYHLGRCHCHKIHTKYNGDEMYVDCSISVRQNEQGEPAGVLRVIRDITEQKIIDEQKLDFYRRTIAAATQGKVIVTEKEEIERITGDALKEWRLSAYEDVADIRHDACEIAVAGGMNEDTVMRFATCIGELASNACKWANGGICSAHYSDDSYFFKVADTGRGIDALNLPWIALLKRYSQGRSAGLGYKVVIDFADNVYIATGPRGTTAAVKVRNRRMDDLLDVYADLAEL